MSHERGNDTTSADRGSEPLDMETSGADSATLDPIHAIENVSKTCGTATIYGYEDYTGGSVHSPK